MSWSAVRALARNDLTRRWRSILLLGLLVGALGGLVVAGAGLTRRTASAPQRLFDAVAPGDAEVRVFGAPQLIPAITALPEVERAWAGQMSVVQLEGPAVIYLGVMAGPPRPAGMLEPVLLSGRRPDPDEPYEILVTENLAEAMSYGPGDRLAIDMLSAEEVGQFDVGFGDPDGPSAEMVVTGIARFPKGVLDSSPILATPAFGERHADVAAGIYLHVDLVGGSADYGSFAAGAADVAESASAPPGSEEFPPVSTSALAAGTDDAVDSARILVGGLIAAVAIAAVAGAFALGQALVRHHSLTSHDQSIEEALGLTATERTLARMPGALVASIVAAAVATTAALAGAGMEPLGALARSEPRPGWLPDGTSVAVGVVGVCLTFLTLSAITTWRAGRGGHAEGSGEPAGGLRYVPWRSGWALTGTTFALSGGGARRTVPVRSSLAGMVLGVTGLVAGLSFGASLDRLEQTPERWGWAGDMVVVDTNDDIQAELLADPRIGALTDVRSSSVLLDGDEAPAHSFEPVSGDMTWTIIEGRDLRAASEVVVGTRLAARRGIEVGDVVEVGDATALVVGLGVGPDVAGDGMGIGILVTAATLQEQAIRQDFREAMVKAAPGVAVDDLAADLGARYESDLGSPPDAVDDLVELDGLPEMLGGFLAVLGSVALVHALALTRTRRARDLAVLQALGSTPRQAAAAIPAMAVTTAVVGVAAGTPLGWAIARLVWGEVARSTGVAPDLLVPESVWLVVAGTVLVSVALALVPAVSVMRARPAPLLRTE